MTEHHRWVSGAFALLLASSAMGCVVTTVAASDADDEEELPSISVNRVGAAGVEIQQVALYQGVKRVLSEANGALDSHIPLVAGREAILRVFYGASPEQVGATVQGRLELAGGEALTVESVIATESLDGDLGTTVNFAIPGARIGADFSYRVSLLQEGLDEDDNLAAHYPAEALESHQVSGPRNVFRLVLAPFRYNADGSGRLPDLSPEQIERYRARFLQLYPVSDVEVTVREPINWSRPIAADGSGWDRVASTVMALRAQDGAAEDVYYYGVFNPTVTVNQFCVRGCLLGVTSLNAASTVAMRMAIGLGFNEVATDTAVHELGHSHGRKHAPCGRGLDPRSIDYSFPYQDGGIGVWGYDIVGKQLVNPDFASDIMGYCDDQWISDYNYAALLDRGANVNAERRLPTPARYQVVLVDGEGRGTWGRSSVVASPDTSETITVRLSGAGGTVPAEGVFLNWDHMPGGMLLLPEARAVGAHKVEMTLKSGMRMTAVRN